MSFVLGLRSLSSQIPDAKENEKKFEKKADNVPKSFANYRHIYAEFLPDPKIEFRNPLREKLERLDMIARRTQIDIPEFYVG